MKKTFIALGLLFSMVACKKSNAPLPSTMQLVTLGGTPNSGFIVPMTIVNQNGVTIFHKDTLVFNDYNTTYTIPVKPGDVLKATWNSNITSTQASSPSVDMKFNYNGQNIDEIEGGIYNTQAYYNNNPSANTVTITIP